VAAVYHLGTLADFVNSRNFKKVLNTGNKTIVKLFCTVAIVTKKSFFSIGCMH